MGKQKSFGEQPSLFTSGESEAAQRFGGSWTDLKLRVLDEYTNFYIKVLMNQPWRRIYVDAFAGCGYRDAGLASDNDNMQPTLVELSDDTDVNLDGSARRRLESTALFDRYVFIEKSQKHVTALRHLVAEFANLSERVDVVCGDANEEVVKVCANLDRDADRAMIFLDPFGMQVDWATLQAIARSGCADVLMLVPLGIGPNRLVTRKGGQPPGWKNKLTRFFGSNEWESVFYKSRQQTLGGGEELVKTASPEDIRRYFMQRLGSVFPFVQPDAVVLHGGSGSPHFFLVLALSNDSKKAQDLANRLFRGVLTAIAKGTV